MPSLEVAAKMQLSLDETPPGAFDQRIVHQFTGRVEVLQLLSFTLTSFFSPARFLLSPALSLSPYCSSFSPLA